MASPRGEVAAAVGLSVDVDVVASVDSDGDMNVANVAGRVPRDPKDALVALALARGQTVRLRATSASMVPTIWPGELVLARRLRPRVGEVALVWTGRTWLAHRVRAQETTRLLLQGDAPRSSPHWVPAKAVHGTIVGVRRDARAWAKLLRACLASAAAWLRKKPRS